MMFHDTSTGTTFPQNGQVGTGLAGGWMLVDGARGGKQTLGADGWVPQSMSQLGKEFCELRAAHSMLTRFD